MTHFTPEVKHSILLEYCAGDNNHGFEALARRHAVRGGRRVVKGGLTDGTELLSRCRKAIELADRAL